MTNDCEGEETGQAEWGSALRYLDPEAFGVLVTLGDPRVLADGEVLFREGEAGDDVFLMVEGRAAAVRDTPMGEVAVGTVGPGELFGEVPFLDQGVRTATVRSEGVAVVRVMPAARLRDAVAGDPTLRLQLLRCLLHSLATKLRGANRAMNEIVATASCTDRRGSAAPGERIEKVGDVHRRALQRMGVPAETLELLSCRLQSVRYAPEALIFAEGDEGDAMYVVLTGGVRISRDFPGLGEEALAILKEGDAFGEMALVDDLPRSADARAHGAGCSLLLIDRACVEAAVGTPTDDGDRFPLALCALLCGRLRQMTDQLVAWRILAGF
jgi:CRP-like cAMP-binding protein